MINLENTSIGLAIAACIYFAFSNIIKCYIENILFTLANIAFAAMLFIYLYLSLYHDSADLTAFSRYFIALPVIILQVVFLILQIYPAWEKRPRTVFIIMPQIPGLALAGLVIFTDLIISKMAFTDSLTYSYGPFVFIYIIITGLYILGLHLSFLFKARHFENASFKKQLLPFQAGLLAGTAIVIFFLVVLPFYFDIHNYQKFSLAGSYFLQLQLNYSLSHDKQIDFKKFYLKVLFRFMLILVLFIPTYFFIEYFINSELIKNNILLFSGTILFPFLFIIIYRYLKPVAGNVINKMNRTLKDNFNSIFRNMSELSEMKKQKMDWDNFFSKGINEVFGILNIEKASFFLLNEELKIFELVHTYNENSDFTDISENDVLISFFRNRNQVIEKYQLYTDRELEKHKNILLDFFNKNDISAILPVFSYTKKLLGLITLGSLAGKKNYSADFLSYLDNYRIQFSSLLENLLFSEEIRKTQVIKRDKMIVTNIKKRIIPANFKNIEGLKISSLYINNSEFGGDFFDSSKVRNDKMGIFTANASDLGVESALLILQMSSVFHAQASMHEAPEGLLNTLNQVLCTSRFTEKYATAIYLIYNSVSKEIAFSNAAFNPLIIFNPKKENFAEFDVEGIPLGIDKSFRYKHTTLLAPPDTIGLCCSQGISTAIDKNGNNYSISRIKDLIRINRNSDPSVLVRVIYDDFNSFTADTKLINDITLIVFKTA
ncbi:MAG: PP2C family protein-serine/threonine phosphatase [Spirochaetota bacterium]